MKNTRTTLNRSITPQLLEWLKNLFAARGMKPDEIVAALNDGAEKLPGLLKSEILLWPVNHYPQPDPEPGQQQKIRFPQSEMLRRASLCRLLHAAAPDEEITFSVEELVLMKELLHDFQDDWPVGGVNLDIVEIIQEINEMAGAPAPVALTEKTDEEAQASSA